MFRDKTANLLRRYERVYLFSEKKKEKKILMVLFKPKIVSVSRCMEFLVNGKKNERQRLLSNFWHVVNH